MDGKDADLNLVMPILSSVFPQFHINRKITGNLGNTVTFLKCSMAGPLTISAVSRCSA
jgi:hypothetical protein